MSPIRSCKSIDCTNLNFFAAIAFMIFLYYVFVFEYLILMDPEYKLACLIVFHVLFLFIIWSFVSVVMLEPGFVPEIIGLLTEKMPKNI
jgi:hypothetical protein